MTFPEVMLWGILKAGRLGHRFRRQEPIGRYIVDFCCRPRRVVVELDGEFHGGEWDVARDAFLESLGYRVVRVENVALLVGVEWFVEELGRLLSDLDRRPFENG